MIIYHTALIWTVVSQLWTPGLAEESVHNAGNAHGAASDYKHVPIIRVQSDGSSCPSGFQAASRKDIPHLGLTCISPDRNLAGNSPVRETKATCCTTDNQEVFIVSVAGHDTPRPGARYSLDAKTCCLEGEVKAETGIQQCRYQDKALKVQQGELTQCCWNAANNDFSVHLKDYSIGLTQPLDKEMTKTLDNPFCPSVYLRAGNATVRASNVEIDAFVELKCKGFGSKADRKNLIINFDRNRRTAGTFHFDFSVGTVVVEVSSQLAETSSHSQQWDIKLHGQVSGTGALGKLGTTFDQTIDHQKLLDLWINMNGVCN